MIFSCTLLASTAYLTVRILEDCPLVTMAPSGCTTLWWLTAAALVALASDLPVATTFRLALSFWPCTRVVVLVLTTWEWLPLLSGAAVPFTCLEVELCVCCSSGCSTPLTKVFFVVVVVVVVVHSPLCRTVRGNFTKFKWHSNKQK